MNKIKDNSKPAVLVYGSCGGYMELASDNLVEPKFKHDLLDISHSFHINNIGLSPEYILFSLTNKQETVIFTIYQGILDAERRKGFYSISLFYEGMRPEANLVFDTLINIQRQFDFQILDPISNSIQAIKVPLIKDLFSLIPELPRNIPSGNYDSSICFLELEKLENRHIPDISSFINNENKARTLFIGNKVLRMSSTALFNGTHSDLLSISETTAIKIVERIKYTRKLEFSAKTLNGKEVPGRVFIDSSGERKEYRNNAYPAHLEFYLTNENSELNFDFEPFDTKSYKPKIIKLSYADLKNKFGSRYTLHVSENSTWKFKISNAQFIQGLQIKYNGGPISHNQGEFTIFYSDIPGIVEITSNTHELKTIQLSTFSIDREHSIDLREKTNSKFGQSNPDKKTNIISGEDTNTTNWFLRILSIAVGAALLILAIILWYRHNNSEVETTCETLIVGNTNFDEYCRKDTACIKCKKSIEKVFVQPTIPDSSFQNHKPIESPAINDTAIPKAENKITDPSLVKGNKKNSEKKLICDNIASKSKNEIKKFCDNEENYSCENCKISCQNYHLRSSEAQKKYCKHIKTVNIVCKECPEENIVPSSQSATQPNVCDALDNNKETLKKLCKSEKFKNCPKCKQE